MTHRHLSDDASTSLMALDDVLERGSPDAWSALVRLVVADPFGAVAERVLTLCRAHPMYGTSQLWPAIVEQLRHRDSPP